MVLVSTALASLDSLNNLKPPFTLPSLGYGYEALEPAVDAATMKVHHDRHHQAYVDNLNKQNVASDQTLIRLFKSISKQPDGVRNHGGGHWNHAFFWTIMTPVKENQAVPARLQKEIEGAFSSMDAFKKQFEEKGTKLFGSGWVWLIRNSKGALEITTTSNQDNPQMDVATTSGVPVFNADVWEHAYYLKYQNKRADYLKAFWNIVNWKQIDEYDQEALKMLRKN